MQNNIEDGFILLDKDSGYTSFQSVNIVKKILNVKKCGHSGTLDKNATGLLLVAIGRSTKLLKYLFKQPKQYIAEILFGIQTNTDDIEGKVINKYENDIEFDNISSFIPDFIGNIKQIPPDYSSIHINGVRAYKLAKLNKKPELKERDVIISNIKILSFDNNILKIKIDCSSGTYIRSIARDLGIKTGYYAHLFSLRRTAIGIFSINNSYKISDIEDNNFSIISPYEIIYNMPALELKNETLLKYIKNGLKIDRNWFKENITNNGLYKVHLNNKLISIIKIIDSYFYYDLVY